METWNDIYKEYGLGEIPWHTEQAEPILRELVDNGELQPGKVLDICSGAGTNTIYLAKNGFDVEGIDISEEAVKIASERCSQAGQKCSFREADVMLANLSQYDLVFDRGCFHHIEDKDEYANTKPSSQAESSSCSASATGRKELQKSKSTPSSRNSISSS